MHLDCHTHTCHSNTRGFLDSTNRIEDLIQYTKELGKNGIVITDHDTISCHMFALDHMKDLRKEDSEKWKDYKLILGNEIYLCSRKEIEEDKKYKFYHFILIAKDKIGHQQIRELSTRAWVDNSFTWVNIRTPTFYDDLFEIVEKDRGHLIGSTACFIKNTPVVTLNGIKNIQDITDEDYIKNKYGEWEKVNFPTSRDYNGIGYKIDFEGEPNSTICTNNHKFLVTNLNKLTKSKNEDEKLEWLTPDKFILKTGGTKTIALMPYKTIYTNNNILYKKDWHEKFYPKSKTGLKRIKILDEIKITPELMRLFGLYLGDGSTDYKNKRITFSFNIEEYPYYKKFVKKALKDCGVTSFHVEINKNHKVEIQIGSVEFTEMMIYLFHNAKSDTKFIPEQLKHISYELDMELCFGYLLADGYFRTRKSGYSKKYLTGEFVYVSASKTLALDFKELLNSLRIKCGYHIRKENIDDLGIHHKKSYYITGANLEFGRIEKKKEYKHDEVVEIFNKAQFCCKDNFIIINNILYKKIRIRKIEEIKINVKVYCLNVNSHSFVCNGVIVHNCLGGRLPKYILEAYNKNSENPNYKKAIKWLKRIDKCFGHGNFFLELQPSVQEDQKIVNNAYIQLSKELDIPYIITTD